jgi:sterol desaturase/sphingolipid hydroxylase (fatty acid hydroxylase superfamily)
MTFSWPQISFLALGLGVLTLTVLEVAWEWRSTRAVPRVEERASNWTCLVVSLALRVSTLPVRVALFAWVAARAPMSLPSTWPIFALCYLLTDLNYYGLHRLLHQTSLGWAVHSVHHTSRAMDLSVAFRLSWPARIVDDLFYLPLVVVGFSPALVLFTIELNLFWQAWVHTEMIGRLGVLDARLNTPSSHRVHHHAAEGGRRGNYGGHFLVWDHLFGTYEPEGEPRAYGTDFGDLGANPVRVQLEGLRRLVTGRLRVR